MGSILEVLMDILMSMTVVSLRLYYGAFEASAAPTFFFWVRILPAVISFLVILLILLVVVPFSYKKPGSTDEFEKNKRKTWICCYFNLRGKKKEETDAEEDTLDELNGTIRQNDKRRIKLEEEEEMSEVIVNKEAEKVTVVPEVDIEPDPPVEMMGWHNNPDKSPERIVSSEVTEDPVIMVTDPTLDDTSSVSTEFLFSNSDDQTPVKPARRPRAPEDKIESERKNYLDFIGSRLSYPMITDNDDNSSRSSEERNMDQGYGSKTMLVQNQVPSPQQRPWYMGPGPGASDAEGSEISFNCDEKSIDDEPSAKSHPVPQPEPTSASGHQQSPKLPPKVQPPASMLSRTLKKNMSLRSTLSTSDFEVMDEFSQTMERLKRLMKKEDVATLERSMATIEHIVGPLELEQDEEDRGGEDKENTHGEAIDSIVSDMECMLEDIDSWAESGC